VDDFLSAHPGWVTEPPLRLAPDTDATDGFFIARLRRA
jgi:16S rRNA C967 or C1407 C5-methylase (RsmB/RsmF family)